MNPRLLSYLSCPVCEQHLATAEPSPTAAANPHPGRPAARPVRALRCPRGHNFDLAKQGYVNLSAGRAPHSGDSAEMVTARAAFLNAGHFDFISAALGTAARALAPAEATPSAYPDLIVDAGAGTGRHLAAVLDALPTAVGLALDVSKPALRRAAGAHPRAGAALCDTWGRLPVVEKSAALILNVFAPRNGAQFHRVLRPDGALLIVTPTAAHLHELVVALDLLRVDPAKADRVAASLTGHFDLASQATHQHQLELTRDEVHTLVGMGPSAWHVEGAGLAERVTALPEPVRITASIQLGIYRPIHR